MDSFVSEAYTAFRALTGLDEQNAWLDKYLTPALKEDYVYIDNQIKEDLRLYIEDGQTTDLRITPRTGVSSFWTDGGLALEDCVVATLICHIQQHEVRKHFIHFVFDDQGRISHVLWTSPETTQEPASGPN